MILLVALTYKKMLPLNLKMIQYYIPNSVSSHQQSYFVQLGPCQPSPLELENKIFPKIFEKNGKFRSFHESYYYKTITNGYHILLLQIKFFVFL